MPSRITPFLQNHRHVVLCKRKTLRHDNSFTGLPTNSACGTLPRVYDKYYIILAQITAETYMSVIIYHIALVQICLQNRDVINVL